VLCFDLLSQGLGRRNDRQRRKLIKEATDGNRSVNIDNLFLSKMSFGPVIACYTGFYTSTLLAKSHHYRSY